MQSRMNSGLNLGLGVPPLIPSAGPHEQWPELGIGCSTFDPYSAGPHEQWPELEVGCSTFDP